MQGYWIKKLTECRERIAEQLDSLLGDGGEIPGWMTYGKTVLCLKDPEKGSAEDNYRPISSFPLMRKLLTGILANEMYEFIEKNNIFREEQKGCKRKSRGTKDQLLINKPVLKDCKVKKANLGMAWIDYRKAFDMVPHSWILECMSMFGIAKNMEELLKSSMANWKTEHFVYGQSLGQVNIKRGIF